MGNSASAREENAKEMDRERVEEDNEETAQQAAVKADQQRLEEKSDGKLEVDRQRFDVGALQEATDGAERNLTEQPHVPSTDENAWLLRRRAAAAKRLEAKTAQHKRRSAEAVEVHSVLDADAQVEPNTPSRSEPTRAGGKNVSSLAGRFKQPEDADEDVETCTVQINNMAVRFPHKTRSEIARDLKKAGGHAGSVAKAYKREQEG